MNKPYFTKYIPVEGEIKEQDYYHHPDHPNTLFRFYEPWDHKKDKAQKVKLFLCSRDIQVGDKLRNKFLEEFTYQEEFKDGWLTLIDKNNDPGYFEKVNCFKVIGEVSPNDIWVKEGMEFDKEDIKFHMKETQKAEIEYWIKFKCPTCNTFH